MCLHSGQGTVKCIQDASKSQGVHTADRILLVQLANAECMLEGRSTKAGSGAEGQDTGGAATASEAAQAVQHRRSVWTHRVLSKRQGEDVQLF